MKGGRGAKAHKAASEASATALAPKHTLRGAERERSERDREEPPTTEASHRDTVFPLSR
jgi:hypothetical protein